MLAELHRVAGEGSVSLRDAVIVVRGADGQLELHQTKEDFAAGEGIVAGGAVGIVVGLLLGGPVGGALVGLVAGGGFGAPDTGIPDDRLRRLGDDLTGAHAVLCVLVGRSGLPRCARRWRPTSATWSSELSTRPWRHSRRRARRRPVTAAEQQIGDAADRERQPERDEPVGEGRDDGLLRADAGERQHSGQARLDETEAARRHRDHGEQQSRRVGEQDELGVRPGADGREAADEREVVEADLPHDTGQRQVPLGAERAPDPVALGEELLREIRDGLPLPTRVAAARAPADERSSGRSQANAAAANGDDDEAGDADVGRLHEPSRRRRAPSTAGSASSGSAKTVVVVPSVVAVSPAATSPRIPARTSILYATAPAAAAPPG